MKSTYSFFSLVSFFSLLFTLSLQAQDCNITIEATSPSGICLGDQVSLAVSSSGDFSWNTTAFLDDSLSNDPIATPTETITYIVTVINDSTCTVSDTLTIIVDDFNFPIFPSEPLEICQGSPIQLVDPTLDNRTQYRWSPSIYLNDSTTFNPVATPEDTTTYKLVATSENGFCSDSAELTVNIIPIDVNIGQEDTVEVCFPAGTTLTASLSDPNLQWSWFPQDSTVQDPNIATISIMTSVSKYYGVSITDTATGCTAWDSVYVRVDSLPDLDTIIAIPTKEIYCPGDQIVLFSRSYTHGNFPDITHEWIPMDGSFKDNDNTSLNAQIEATSTKTFSRINENHACRTVDTIRIKVVDPVVTVTPMDTLLCPGESVNVEAVYEPDPSFRDFEWMPEDGIVGANDRPNITIQPQTSGTWMVQGEYMGCPIGGSTTVNVAVPPAIALNAMPGTQVFTGTEVTITAVTSVPGSDFVWMDGNQTLPETGPTIVVNSNEEESRTFSVSYFDVNGCPASSQITITWDLPPFTFEVPKAFIPDGDSENKVFLPHVQGASIEEILVYNRFGQLVYNGVNGWDGDYNGGEAPSDTYMYVITVMIDQTNEIRKKQGSVTLLR